jgi:hypothetical protein
MTTPGHTFYPTGDAEQNLALFTVTPNIPLSDALQSISEILSATDAAIYAAAMGEQPLQGDCAWLVRHAVRSAKATVDSLIEGAAKAGN